MYKNLRRRKPISYFEPEEPGLDEYIYCDQCADIVFEYCSIHGPLLVIPDDQVPHKRNVPSFVPRAALTIPNVFLHIAPSIIPGAGLGVFTTLTLPRGVRFGPYRGEITKEVNSVYCWQIYDGNNKRSHVVDAQDGNKSNWMRYVNCSRHWREQNLVAYQYQGQLYYRTIKIIPRYTELLIFYGSEFTNILNIDLRSYHSKEHHLTTGPTQILEETIKVKSKNNETDFGVVSVINDDFLDNDEETKVETQPIEHSTVNINDDRKSPVTVIYDYDNQCFKVEFQNTSNNNKEEELIDKKFRCEQCNFVTSYRRNLKRHALKRHSIYKQEIIVKQIQCDQCDFKTSHPQCLKRHLLALHSTFQDIYKCNQCRYKTNMMRNYNRHCRIHKMPRTYRCQRCTNDFPTKTLFDEHKEKCQSKLKCIECKYETMQPYAFKEHMQRHTKDTIYQCDQCPYFAHVKKDLLKHKRNKSH